MNILEKICLGRKVSLVWTSMRWDLKLALKFRFVERKKKVHSKWSWGLKRYSKFLFVWKESPVKERLVLRNKDWKGMSGGCLLKILMAKLGNLTSFLSNGLSLMPFKPRNGMAKSVIHLVVMLPFPTPPTPSLSLHHIIVFSPHTSVPFFIVWLSLFSRRWTRTKILKKNFFWLLLFTVVTSLG